MVALGFRAGQTGQAIEADIESALRGSDSVHALALGPLAPSDAQVLMGIDDPAEAESHYRGSGGNPFYMLELGRARVAGDASAPRRRTVATCPAGSWRP